MPPESPTPISTFINRLTSTPFITAFATARPEPSNHDSTNPDHRDHLDRLIIINPITQAIVVISGNSTFSTHFESLFNEFVTQQPHPPASQASIDSLPVVDVKGGDEVDECVICLEGWGIGDVVKEMACKHRFHGGCVERWLRRNGSCPICRRVLPVVEEKSGGGSGRVRREIWMTCVW